MMVRALGWVALACLLTSLGCAARPPFDTTFPLSQPDQLSALLAQARQRPRSAGSPVVVGVSAAPHKLFAYDLGAQRLLWSEPADVQGVPRVAGAFVASHEGQTLKLRELRSGRVAHSLPTQGLQLVGADGDDELAAVVLASGGSYGARSRLILVHGTRSTKQLQVGENLGTPAVQGGFIFVPHGRVHLSVLSAEGQELARVRVRDDVASEALSNGRDVFFGMAGLYHLNEQTSQGVAGGAHYFAPEPALRRKLPGSPDFLRDTTKPAPPVESAIHRISLSFWPEASAGGVGLADDALYLSFYRTLFALHSDAQRVHWARSLEADLVGVQATSGGVIAVDERGVVRAFTADGRATYEASMGIAPVVASVRAAGLPDDGAIDEAQPLVEQLRALAAHEDTRLVPAGELAIRLLAAQPEDDAGAALVELCERPQLTRRLREAACEQLAQRSQGSEAVLVALSRHYDHMAGSSAPPLAPLAKAAAAAGERRAAPLLVAHLEDPASEDDALPELMRALVVLNDASVKPALARFLRLYHADAAEPGLEAALLLSLPLLADDNALLASIASDEMSNVVIREACRKQLEAPAKDGEQAGTPSKTEASAESEGLEQPPARLAAEHLRKALQPVQEQLRECVRRSPAHLVSARLTVVVESDGTVSSVRTLPDSLAPCVEPHVRSIKLPESAFGKREVLHHTLTR